MHNYRVRQCSSTEWEKIMWKRKQLKREHEESECCNKENNYELKETFIWHLLKFFTWPSTQRGPEWQRSKMKSLDFPRGPVVKNLSASEGVWFHVLWSSTWAVTTEPTCPRACAQQLEKPLHWDVCTLAPREQPLLVATRAHTQQWRTRTGTKMQSLSSTCSESVGKTN